MDRTLVPFLTCPQHPTTPLALERIDRERAGAIEQGTLSCRQCNAHYPVIDGILDLIGQQWPTSLTHLINELPLTAWAYERAWRPQALSLLSGEPFSLERELTLITELAGVERGGIMIDVACSNGLYARALEQARQRHGVAGWVVGIDYSMAMLREAQQRARRERLSISYIRARAQALPFAPATANALVMGGSLNEIGDIPAALAEWRRLLGSRGRGVLMNLVAAANPVGRLAQQVMSSGGLQFPDIHELNRLFAAAGLRLRAQWQYGVVVISVVVGEGEEDPGKTLPRA